MELNRRRVALVLVASAVSVVGLTSVEIAGATHPHPRGATPFRVPIVPAYKQCTAPNSNHGGGINQPSCNPPVQSSSYLTVGTPDSNGAAANSIASLTMKVQSSPADFLMTLNATDIRCKPSGPPSFCSSANVAGGPDYSGEISIQQSLRITDHWNSRVQFPPPTDPYDQPGTMVDVGGFVMAICCASTASTSIGGTCSINTSGNAIEPGFSPAVGGKRFVMELGQLQVFDGGPDGQVPGGISQQDDTLFGVQGLFVP
jgi:hypothetical protein